MVIQLPMLHPKGRVSLTKAAPNRRAAARRKRSSDELRQRPAGRSSPGVSQQSRLIEMLQRGQGSTIAAIGLTQMRTRTHMAECTLVG